MESNLDDIFYQKYQLYKNKYIKLKKNNNLHDGGFFNWNSSTNGSSGEVKKIVSIYEESKINNNNMRKNASNKSKNASNYFSNSVAKTNNSDIIYIESIKDDGTYLVFNIGKSFSNDDFLDMYKKYIQESYDEETKTGIMFDTFDTFIDMEDFNEKSFLIRKNNNNITCNIISRQDVNIYDKIEQIKNDFDQNDNDPIKISLKNNCHEKYISDIQIKINNLENINDTDLNTKLNELIEEERKKQDCIYLQYDEFNENAKKEIDKILQNYLKYKTLKFDINYQLNKNNNKIFLDELKDEIRKNLNLDLTFNMILKIDKNYDIDSKFGEYKFAEYINKDSVSITSKYTEIVAALTKRRYARALSPDPK